jgi:hypothetical protein
MNNTAIAVIAIVSALALLGAAIVTIPLQQQAYAQATTVTSRERFRFDAELLVPCAAGGEGELVHLTGELHALFHVTLDSAGGGHAKIHINTEGLIGTGLTTGDKYHGHQVIKTGINVKKGVQVTQVITLHIIGQGNAPNFLGHLTLHTTVNPDGTVTADVSNLQIKCK